VVVFAGVDIVLVNWLRFGLAGHLSIPMEHLDIIRGREYNEEELSVVADRLWRLRAELVKYGRQEDGEWEERELGRM
jgi:hypothetical protein